MGADRFDERRRRLALNEAAFRKINESLAGLNGAFAESSGQFVIVCECDDTACLDEISMSPDEYDALRSHATLFAVVPGHDSPTVEQIVERHEGFHVVAKHEGEPAAIAVTTDPRG